MHKIVKIGLVVLGAIAAILWSQLPDSDAPVGEAVESGAVHWMFMIMYILLAFAVVFSMAFALKNIASNPAGLKRTLIGIVGLLVVVVIAYALSDGDDGTVEEMAKRGVSTTEGTVKNIGTGLNVFFILVLVAIGTMMWGGLKKVMNK